MLKFNAHLGFQFTEAPFLERFSLAAQAGFKAVEFPSPYEYAPEQIRDLLQEHQLSLVQFASPLGGGKGLAAVTGREAEFREGLKTTVRYAKALDCSLIHLMSGSYEPGSASTNGKTYIENIRYASDYLTDEGLTPVIEVISPSEVPGYFMRNFELAEAALELAPDLKLIMDVFHAELLTGNTSRTVDFLLGRTSHIQIADYPGRHEPGTGKIDFAALFKLLRLRRYEGWVGCEYRPATTTTAGLPKLWEFLNAQ